MKFSDIREEEWPALRPYLDTCLLPVTGLTGEEEPWQAVQKLERLRDVLELIEVPFNGRIVTYPAYHYTDEGISADALTKLVSKLRTSGFRYIIVAVIDGRSSQVLHNTTITGCDLIVDESMEREVVRKIVAAMWEKSPNIA